MLNVKVDTMERFVTDSDGNRVSSDFVYVEEPTTGYYDIPYRGHQKQRTIMQIYFCKFEPMANDAYKGDTKFSQNSPTIGRLELKNQIEEQMVRPFLYFLKTSELGLRHPEIFNTIRIMYPSPRFDANEVSVGLELTVTQEWCLDAYKPIPPAPPEPKPVRLVDIIHEGFNMRGITITFENTESKPVDKSVVSEYISTNTDPKVLISALYPYGAILCGRPLTPAYTGGEWKLKEYTFPDTEDLIVIEIKVKPEGEFPDVWTFRDIYTMV
ncbi:MAG: hypothetical protein KH842_09480 [Firmicutes bacterium]|nr:hypothetical protein [Bacillota bacterium]